MFNINPFPVPVEIQEAIQRAALSVVLPESTQRWQPDESCPEPAFMDAFNEWHMRTEGSTEGLINLALDLRPPRDEQTPDQNIKWDFLINGIDALDFRLKQFEALLWWARQTWQHDPLIKKIVCASAEPETASPQTKGRD